MCRHVYGLLCMKSIITHISISRCCRLVCESIVITTVITTRVDFVITLTISHIAPGFPHVHFCRGMCIFVEMKKDDSEFYHRSEFSARCVCPMCMLSMKFCMTTLCVHYVCLHYNYIYNYIKKVWRKQTSMCLVHILVHISFLIALVLLLLAPLAAMVDVLCDIQHMYLSCNLQ